MEIKVEIGYNDDDEMIVETLPAKFEVCHECEGHGYVLNPSMRGHCYSAEEFHDAFEDEDDRAEYFKRGGRYDVVCPCCNGKNVVKVIDEEACNAKPELKAIMQAYHTRCDELFRERQEDARIYRMECGMWE